ncbi:hypothetical protein SAMN05421786_101606 [Chryseobacterium ureilyticum]|uniref:Uncharacterized protein n=1 Tax=Chryseobacterium ureilyticum TaxID=373668 RepID=A0A1N7KMN5_9FLAO|nr:hypothetical protein SAMN05421786_101606 [Chryseobacterium ureilyticum]
MNRFTIVSKKDNIQKYEISSILLSINPKVLKVFFLNTD